MVSIVTSVAAAAARKVNVEGPMVINIGQSSLFGGSGVHVLVTVIRKPPPGGGFGGSGVFSGFGAKGRIFVIGAFRTHL
jgi:hypothetical protein